MRRAATCESALEAALRTLGGNRLWQNLMGENIYWSSNEAFLQGSLLAALNDAETVWCDRERSVIVHGQRMAPDLWLLPATEEALTAWWSALSHKMVDRPDPCGAVALGIVELKLAWIDRWATGSARIGGKVKQIEQDLDKMAVLAGGNSAWDTLPKYSLVTVGGYAPPDELEHQLEEAWAAIEPVAPRAVFDDPIRLLGKNRRKERCHARNSDKWIDCLGAMDARLYRVV